MTTAQPAIAVGALTPRQRQILPLVADGLNNVEIGRLLYVDPGTVKYHVGRLVDTLGARNRTHAVHLAHLAGLLGGGER